MLTPQLLQKPHGLLVICAPFSLFVNPIFHMSRNFWFRTHKQDIYHSEYLFHRTSKKKNVKERHDRAITLFQ